MSRRLIVWRGLLVAALCGTAPAWGAASLRSVVLEQSTATGARVVLELSAPVDRKVMSLNAPDRLVLDLAETRLAAGTRLPHLSGAVASIRAGMQPHHTLRLVMETRKAMASNVRVDTRTGGAQRLIVEFGDAITSTTSAAPVAVRPAHAPDDSGRDIIVAVDAGHGGKDPGAGGNNGTHEKDVVLAIAQALARRINAEPGMKAVLTRNDDRFIELRERINLARAARADLFVSVHADSIRNRDVSGSSVYVLSERAASSEAARWLADQENAADLKGGVSLGDKSGQLASVLMDLSQTASIEGSMEAAQRVLTQLDQVGTVRKSRVQQAPFLVLKSPDIPSMLVETAYISNPGEERKLRSLDYQTDLADAIFKGVRDYFRSSPPDGSLFARQQKPRAGAAIIAGSTGP